MMKKLNILIRNSKKITPLEEKKIIKSKVVGWDTKHVYLNLGVKKESSVLRKEFVSFNMKPSLGTFINVLVDRINTKASDHKVSYIKAQFKTNWAFINSKYKEGDFIKGKVVESTRGGFTANVGIFSFLPLSQINLQVPKNTGSFIGKCFVFKILKINYEKRNLILSRREIIEQERSDKKKQLLKSISVGNVCWGTVKNITAYGIFVDINGIDGLLHVTDVSWKKSLNYKSLKLDQSVKVIIIDINKERCRVSLGIKQLKVNPQSSVIKKLKLGLNKLCTTEGGASLTPEKRGFTGLFEGLEAFNLSGSDLKKGVVSYVDVKRRSVFIEDNVNKTDCWLNSVADLPLGFIIECTVRRMFKKFLHVEFTNKTRGILHLNDLNWTKFEDPKNILNTPTKFKVLSRDIKNMRVVLGKKQIQANPFDILKSFNVGDTILGKVIKLVSYGAFIKINKKLDGLLHSSQFDGVHWEKVDGSRESIFKIKSNAIKLNEFIKIIIIKVDTTNFKVSLSLKASYYNEEKFKNAIKEYSFIEEAQPNYINYKNTELSNLGDFFNFKETF